MRSVPSLVSALAAACLLAAASSAHAAPSDAEALAAIQRVDPSIAEIQSNVPSHAGTRAAIVAAQTTGAGAGVGDLWLVGDDGSVTAVSDYRATLTSDTSEMLDPQWSADDAKVAVSTDAPTRASSAMLAVYTTGPVPSTFAQVRYGATATFTADGRYLVVYQVDDARLQLYESAVDLQSGAVYKAYTWSAVTQSMTSVARECARSQQAGWRPAVPSDDVLVGWLSEPDPGCTFPRSATPTP